MAFVWGSIGGLAAALTVFVLPELVHIQRTGGGHWNLWAFLATVGLVILLSALAGLLCLIPDHMTRGQAILAGLASQGTLRGIIAGAKDAVRH